MHRAAWLLRRALARFRASTRRYQRTFQEPARADSTVSRSARSARHRPVRRVRPRARRTRHRARASHNHSRLAPSRARSTTTSSSMVATRRASSWQPPAGAPTFSVVARLRAMRKALRRRLPARPACADYTPQDKSPPANPLRLRPCLNPPMLRHQTQPAPAAYSPRPACRNQALHARFPARRVTRSLWRVATLTASSSWERVAMQQPNARGLLPAMVRALLQPHQVHRASAACTPVGLRRRASHSQCLPFRTEPRRMRPHRMPQVRMES